MGRSNAVNSVAEGTKAAAWYRTVIPPGGRFEARLRLTSKRFEPNGAFVDFENIFKLRCSEADEFFGDVVPEELSPDAKNVMRQAFAGLMWSKQYYHYVVREWIDGDPTSPPPPERRRSGRNKDWGHLYNADILSMPDKWEYPWYAAWDLAFHCLPIALIDSEFAKEQLILLLREWYMHPNGQIPAYEWAF